MCWTSCVGRLRRKRVTLTVWVALAELLTEILSHDAGAGAVAGAVWVVAGLVVVHLCGRVIWKRREQTRALLRSCSLAAFPLKCPGGCFRGLFDHNLDPHLAPDDGSPRGWLFLSYNGLICFVANL